MLSLRDYQGSDLDAVVELFQQSVHTLAAGHYDRVQREAWAPRKVDLQAWHSRLSSQRTRLALIDEQLAGFIACTDDGHIDLLYASPHHARQGVASALYQDVEADLIARGATSLSTEASLVAQGFFEHQGFVLEQLQTVFRGAVGLQRGLMRKLILPRPTHVRPV
ncbi:MAG: GNAT family N-acetyltransferase [Pseudomonas sp.]|uniref:GNAT family N-acetyltransferase n=1 Tax=Pseudomonas sp. TaxID=306 RepID=UPI0033908E83